MSPKLSDLLGYLYGQYSSGQAPRANQQSAPNRLLDNRPVRTEDRRPISPPPRVDTTPYVRGSDYTPGSREYFADMLYGARANVPDPQVAAKNRLLLKEEAMNATPLLGELLSAKDAYNSFNRASETGNLSDYAFGGLATLGAIPLAGYLARGFSRGRNVMDSALPERANKLLDRASPDPNALYAFPAWHGSPHDFDKFDTTKTKRTSEGHGVYLSSDKKLSSAYTGADGKLYRVEVDADLDDLIPYDKPINTASKKVVDAAERLKSAYNINISNDKTGGDLMRELSTKLMSVDDFLHPGNSTQALLDSDRKASEILSKFGILGTRNTDKSSYTTGKHVDNYTIFDDRLIKIVDSARIEK